MNASSDSLILEFETYLLMTMKFRMSTLSKEAKLEAKLREYGVSASAAERTHARVADFLYDDAMRFTNLTDLLKATGPARESLRYHSVLWPDFDFNALAGQDGRLESAGYRRARGEFPQVYSPTDLAVWGADVSEFAEQFGPLSLGHRWSLFDKRLPATEEHEFQWQEKHYGAGFCWGLFLFVAEVMD
jgi:hypothetical protein